MLKAFTSCGELTIISVLNEGAVMDIINLAAYQFQTLSEDALMACQAAMRSFCEKLNMMGLIILSPEGLNMMVAGEAEVIAAFKDNVETLTPFKQLHYKESLSATKPFSKMIVKIKPFSIPFPDADITPQEKTAAYISAQEFKAWQDANKEMIVLDTRNDYEVRTGSFDNAIDFGIKTFTDFPNHLDKLPNKKVPIVTFCTGGIRCEKAATWLAEQGYENVYQLDGGILEYFAQCGGAHYHGECFVFDKRVAVDANLNETQTVQCFDCRNPLSVAEQAQLAVNNRNCPYCEAKRNAA